jgi:hypothetical protein
MEGRPWRGDHGGETMEGRSWRGDHGGETMEGRLYFGPQHTLTKNNVTIRDKSTTKGRKTEAPFS